MEKRGLWKSTRKRPVFDNPLLSPLRVFYYAVGKVKADENNNKRQYCIDTRNGESSGLSKTGTISRLRYSQCGKPDYLSTTILSVKADENNNKRQYCIDNPAWRH
jgi:hypothetical protein